MRQPEPRPPGVKLSLNAQPPKFRGRLLADGRQAGHNPIARFLQLSAR
jgi:hypothetical protein